MLLSLPHLENSRLCLVFSIMPSISLTLPARLARCLNSSATLRTSWVTSYGAGAILVTMIEELVVLVSATSTAVCSQISCSGRRACVFHSPLGEPLHVAGARPPPQR